MEEVDGGAGAVEEVGVEGVHCLGPDLDEVDYILGEGILGGEGYSTAYID